MRLVAARDGDALRFDVIDTGIGMRSDQVERLFRPFEQADTSTTRRFGGTGLGLAISSRLVDLMKGSLSVDSTPGRGSRFTFRLPLVEPTAPRETQVRDIVLTGFDHGEVLPVVAALARRAVSGRIEAPAKAFERAAELVVVDCRALDTDFSAATKRALDAGRRVAVVCRHQDHCVADPGLRERMVRIDTPLRARHLIDATRANLTDTQRALPSGKRLDGVRVLAAEDNALNRVVLEEMLQLEGARLSVAEDGERALSILDRDGAAAYDVVLTDIQMPGIDGYETTRRILAMAPKLPVIGLTAHAMREERERCLAAGMVEHLAKPIDLDALVIAIRRHVPHLGVAPVRTEAHPLPADVARSAQFAEGPVIDWAALEERFPGREAFIDRLAQTLLRTQGETPARLREAVAHDDRAALVFIAHTLKGMAGNLMAQPLHALARETEMAAREESPHCGDLARKLADAMQDVIDAVHRRLEARGVPIDAGSA